MKTLKTILALGLVAVFFAGCAKNANNTNTTTTTNTASTDNTKASGSPSMPKMPSMPTMPANTSTTPASNDNSSAPTAPSGEGETFTNQAAGVQFTLPSGWTSKTQGQSIIANSPMDAVSVVFEVPEEDFNKAVQELGERLDNIIQNGKVTSPGRETTHNGMRAFTAGGTGEVNGQPIAWEVDILQANKPFFVLTFAAPDMFKMHQGEYQQLLNSIKRIE